MGKNKWPCQGKPGMYHCEFCGEMQLASVPHLAPQFPSAWEEPFPRLEECSDTPSTTCPACGILAGVAFTREEESFPYGAIPHIVELSAVMDKGRCSACLFEFTDWRAEIACDEAVQVHLLARRGGTPPRRR